MKYKESISRKLNIKQINILRESVGWKKRRSDKKWKEVLSKSSFVYSVWDGNRMVGMGRILEDGSMYMFYDIAVHKDYQGKGIGKIIMKKLIDKVKNKRYTSIGLFMAEENIKFLSPFYKKFGFKIVKTGMECKKCMK